MLSQHIPKILHVVMANRLPRRLGIYNVMWMLEDGLDVTKLAEHPLQLILDLTRSVSEPSRVKIDFLKQTCLVVGLIRVY